MKYYSAIRKCNNAICSMNGPRNYYTMWSMSDKDKYHDITYMWNLKYDTNELIYKTERLTDVENKFMITKEEGEGIKGSLRLADKNCYV